MTAMLLANAARTSERSGSASALICGIAAYAISVPAGNCARNAAGSFL